MCDEPKKTPWWKDTLLLAGELAARQVYWRSPPLRKWVKRWRARRHHTPQVADREELKAYLRRIGVVEGALVMAHTSTLGLRLTEDKGTVPFSSNENRDSPPGTALTEILRSAQNDNKPSPSPAAGEGRCSATKPPLVAKQLLDDLLELVGESGTLVMPTNAAYQTENEYRGPVDGTPQRYDPSITPCGVGLTNELFRRSPGTQRSLHPFNMLAARGPLAVELLRDNLNDSKPLAHGVYSGYYRFCQRNGLVVSIGVPLGRCMTLVHTGEDVRDQEWPIPDFFEEKRYFVRVEGETKEWVVRQPRLVYGKFCLCMRKFVRDLVGAGILHEDVIGGIRVGWAHSREVFDFLMQRNRLSPYPYYGTRWVRKCR